MSSNEEVLPSGLFDFLVFPVSDSEKITFEGHSHKGLMVVLGEETAPELKDFLAKILSAVGFDLSADALSAQLNGNQKMSFANFARSHSINHALFFGIKPQQAQLNFNAPLYHPFNVNGISFLFADQLSAIHSNQNLKRPLWEGLKSMFEK